MGESRHEGPGRRLTTAPVRVFSCARCKKKLNRQATVPVVSSAGGDVGVAASVLTVLLIDDQRTMRKIARQLLAPAGISDIIEAENGQEALDTLTHPRAPDIDLIICDLTMEKMDGLEFCNAVRRHDALKKKQIPIILLTAETDEFILDIARQVGAADVANKPISGPELLSRIERLVGIKLEIRPPN